MEQRGPSRESRRSPSQEAGARLTAGQIRTARAGEGIIPALAASREAPETALQRLGQIMKELRAAATGGWGSKDVVEEGLRQ